MIDKDRSCLWDATCGGTDGQRGNGVCTAKEACLRKAYYHSLGLMASCRDGDADLLPELYGNEKYGEYLFLARLSFRDRREVVSCDPICLGCAIHCHLRRTPREKREEI